jgi:hypothetical protein
VLRVSITDPIDQSCFPDESTETSAHFGAAERLPFLAFVLRHASRIRTRHDAVADDQSIVKLHWKVSAERTAARTRRARIRVKRLYQLVTA